MREDDDDFDPSEDPDAATPDGSKGECLVYFLSLVDPADPGHDFELIKVGVTRHDVFARIEQLQTGNPYQIRHEASFRSPVGWQVENWVHRANRPRVVRLEWLRVARADIPELIETAKKASARLSDVARANARWRECESTGEERKSSDNERRLHAEARRVRDLLLPVKIRLERAEATIAIYAGPVARIPGVVQAHVVLQPRRFNPDRARELFPHLAASHAPAKVCGSFRWRGVATRRSTTFADLRADVDRLKQARVELNSQMLSEHTWVERDGQLTPEVARVHGEYLMLKQQEARLKLEDLEIEAEMVRALEDAPAIVGVCSFRRTRKPTFNSKSFCAAHPEEGQACFDAQQPYVRRRIYGSRSY